MKKYFIVIIYGSLLIVLLLSAFNSRAQVVKSPSVNDLIVQQHVLVKNTSPEKIYLQLNKTGYVLDDTLWFKAYLFNASSLQASAKSNIAYIEISDENNIVLLRRLIPLTNGLGMGFIPLHKLDFAEGGYTLRAYTQWMRNFDEGAIFKTQFFISDVTKDKWFINFSSAIKYQTAQLHLLLTGMDKKPIANQQILLGIRQDENILKRDKPQVTSPQGELDLAVSIRDKPEPAYVSLHSGSYDDKTPLYKFPIIYNRPEKTDLQFMPEGGYLVNGINSIIAFKAISEGGKSIAISGTIVSANNEEVAVFKSNSKGMGSFEFAPQANTIYKAVVNLPGGIKREYPLPATKPAGTILAVINSENDSIKIKITASPSLNNHYILIGQSRGLICFAAKIALVNNTKTLKAPKSAFASGIVRFTLLNEQLATLNERIIYVDHHDNLQINLTSDKIIYTPQDSIALHLQVRDSNGKPVQGAFSMSVINDLQLNNNMNNTSIAVSLLLTSDLKGNVEDPAYYFTVGHQKELDELLLTQGWTGFDWKNLFLPQVKPAFAAEPDISIGGRVVNLFDKGVKNATVNLFSLKPLYSINIKTDDNGNFTIRNIPQTDSAWYIRARNSSGNASTYAINLDKPEWPVFSNNNPQMPWYVNIDTSKLKINDAILQNEDKLDSIQNLGLKVLKEVEIKEKKVIQGSHNLNGPGNADQTIDEHDIAKMGNVTLLELLRKQVKGFRTTIDTRFLSPITGKPLIHYYINTESVRFIFDGLRPTARSTDITDLLTNVYTSDDIKGIEVMSKAFTSSYEQTFAGEMIRYSRFPLPFIEITTRAGKGAIKKNAPADLTYKPIPVVSFKEFYRPAYTIKNSANAAFDNRTTIHWEPNIITDKEGKATVTFYAAGQPATYTITVEGSNMNGNVGNITQKLLVK